MSKTADPRDQLASLADPQARELLEQYADASADAKKLPKLRQAFADACERAIMLGLRNRNGRVGRAEVAEAFGADARLSPVPQGQGGQLKPARKRSRK